MTSPADARRAPTAAPRAGVEYATLAWSVAGAGILAFSAVAALGRARRLGLGSLVEIGASAVVIWELSGTGGARQGRPLRLIACSLAALTL